jgi:predicted extracellular nuclease
VVVGDYQGSTGNGDLDGFYLQDPDGDADPATSDGVFVHDPLAQEVSAGDVVRVRGTAQESFGQTQLGSVDARAVCSTGGPLPPAATIDLPANADTLEQREGMLVEIPEEMTVNESRNLDDFGEVRISAGGLLRTPTEVAEPGPEAVALAEENERRTIILDDGLDGSFNTPVPFLGPEQTLRRRDSVTGLEAVLGFGFSAYRLRPIGPIAFTEHNPRPDAPGDVGGDFQVASFNVLNYFTTLRSRGAQTAEELEDQEAKIVAAINGLGADVVALEEIESNDDLALETLVDALNEDAEGEVWAAVPQPENFTGTDLITVALIYRVEQATPVGDSIAFPDPAFAIARQPIAQAFQASGETFTVIANHFKSKSCSGATGGDADQGDGQGCFNPTRVAQSEALLEFIDELQAASGDPDVVAFGDFNAYAQEDPVDTLEEGGLSDLGEQVPEAQRYTYVFDGYQGSLDHAFATASLAGKVTGVAPWHVNADEPDAFQYNGAGALYAADPFRSSDHDPELIGIDASGPPGPINTEPPRVSGTPKVGHKLRCHRGKWDAAESFEFRWLRDGKRIKGATANRYELRRADRRHRIACRVIAFGAPADGGTPRASADSQEVGPVKRK